MGSRCHPGSIGTTVESGTKKVQAHQKDRVYLNAVKCQNKNCGKEVPKAKDRSKIKFYCDLKCFRTSAAFKSRGLIVFDSQRAKGV